jgi:signal transduction histidine kinase
MHPGLPSPDDPQALLAASHAARLRGAHRDGARLADQARAAATALGDDALAGDAQALLALHQVRLGDVEAAVASGQRALVQLAAGGMPAAVSRVHSTLSLAYERAGLHSLAVAHAATALDGARACGDTTAECWALNRLGTAADDSAGHRHGLDLLSQALALASQLPGLEAHFSALNNLSRRWVLEADRLRGEPARQALQEALLLADAAARIAAAGLPGVPVATAAANLGGIHRRLGDAAQARRHFQQALDLARAHGYGGLVATVDLALASLAFETTPDLATQQALVQQLAPADTGADPDLRLHARHLLVQGCRARGDLAMAIHQLETAHAEVLAAQSRRADLQTRLLFNRAELDQARHVAERARLDAEVQRLRADAEHLAARQLALDRDLLEREVATRTAELLRAKSVAEAASRAKSAFLSIVSHELRTPLNGMLGLVELVRRHTADARQAAQLATAVAAGWQLNSLFDSILNYVSADPQGPAVVDPTDVRSLLQGVLAGRQGAAQAKGMALDLQLPASLPAQLLLDGQRLVQIVDALLDNAVKFSDAGTVRLCAHWLPDDSGPARLRVDVADDGPGLDDTVLARLFRPFELGDASSTRSHGGLGLGLALAQRLAQGMGGDVGVDNHPPTGCTFWVNVPVAGAGNA